MARPIIQNHPVLIPASDWSITEFDVVLHIRCPECQRPAWLPLVEKGAQTVFDVAEDGVVFPIYVCMNQRKNSRICGFAGHLKLGGY